VYGWMARPLDDQASRTDKTHEERCTGVTMDQLTTGTRGALLEHGTCGCPFLTVDVASRPGLPRVFA